MGKQFTINELNQQLKIIRKKLEIIAKYEGREFPKNYCIEGSMFVFGELKRLYDIDAFLSNYKVTDLDGTSYEHWINEPATVKEIYIDITADQFQVFKNTDKYGIMEDKIIKRYYTKASCASFGFKEILSRHREMTKILKKATENIEKENI